MTKILEVNKTQTNLEKLVVFDRLEVGPIKIEKKRIVAPYTIFKKDFSF